MKLGCHLHKRFEQCEWPILSLFFIPRQHAMHANRDISMENASVCPSVRHTLVLYLNEGTYRQDLSTIW